MVLSLTQWRGPDLKRISAVSSAGPTGRSNQQIRAFNEYRGFISHPMARVGSVRGSEYKRFHLPATLAVPPSKYGTLTNIGGFISHPMVRVGSVRGSEYKRFHLPAPLQPCPKQASGHLYALCGLLINCVLGFVAKNTAVHSCSANHCASPRLRLQPTQPKSNKTYWPSSLI